MTSEEKNKNSQSRRAVEAMRTGLGLRKQPAAEQEPGGMDSQWH
jgi:hypothetical protein